MSKLDPNDELALWRKLFQPANIAYALAIASVGAYLLWPLAEDPALHFAGVHQALNSSGGIATVWNFRGIAYNIYLALLHAVATTWFDFFDSRHFDPTVRATHLLVSMAACAFFAHGLSKRMELASSAAWQGFTTTVFLATATWPTMPLHAEDVGAVALLFALGFALRDTTRAAIVAGLLCALLPFVKGISAVYALPLLLLLAAERPQRRLLPFGAAFLGMVLAEIVVLWQWAPLQLIDLWETAFYQGDSTIAARLLSLPRLVRQVGFNPALVAGALATSIVLPRLLLAHRLDLAALLGGLWVFPLFAIVVQGRYYTYHLSPIFIATATSLIVLPTVLTDSLRRRERLVWLGLLGCLLVSLAFAQHQPSLVALVASTGFACAPLTPWQSSATARQWSSPLLLLSVASLWLGSKAAPTPTHLESAWRRVTANEKTFSAIQERVGKGSTLLLAAYGTSARYLDIHSACRHFFPVPIERARFLEEERRKLLRGYAEISHCFAAYRGQYVLLETTWLSKKELRETELAGQYVESGRFQANRRKYVLLKAKPSGVNR